MASPRCSVTLATATTSLAKSKLVELVLHAAVGAFPLWTAEGENVVPDSLPLSPRLLEALEDWTAFYDDVGGAMSDADVIDEFVGQGYKIAHAIRRELKGSTIWLSHPVTEERTRIERRSIS